MKIVKYPDRSEWDALLQRPSAGLDAINESVRGIIADVRSRGDEALRELTLALDGAALTELAVSPEEFEAAERRVPAELKQAIEVAKANIEKFHESQAPDPERVETTPGVFCWRRAVPIESVGLYVPAGTAPLFSAVLMLAIPARLAGCREIVLCSPPDGDGKVADAVLYAAKACGVTRVFKAGGAQAIAAMAYGTRSIPRVYKIFGPGNNYVTRAKQLVSTDVAIDMPAGPSEVAVLADETCVPRFVAADLLSQAEHGPDSQVVLVSTSEKVIDETLLELEGQLSALPRRETAAAALANSTAVVVGSISEGTDLLNAYAAEHLILAVKDAGEVAGTVTNAGSVFLGNYSCEAAGDYASGTNHTLPTAGFARGVSGVSLDSFVKKITFQELTLDGIRNLGPTIEVMAAAEGLDAHKRAVSVRLEAINEV